MGRRLVSVGRKYPPHPTFYIVYYNGPDWEPQADPEVEDYTDWDLERKIELESRDIDG